MFYIFLNKISKNEFFENMEILKNNSKIENKIKENMKKNKK